MTTKIYPKWKESAASLGAGSGTKPTGTLKAVLIDTGVYTYNDAHQYYSSAQSAAVGTPTALANVTFTNGVIDADDVTFASVTGNSVEAFIVFLDTGSAATSPMISFTDNRVQVEVGADAASGATSVTVEDLVEAIGNGVALTKISGTGPTTITTSAAASAGARSISVTALGSGITAGAVYEWQVGSGLPIQPNGGNITLNFSAAGIVIL